jgi:hypothetical protein
LFGDPKALQNERRAAYEASDEGLTKFNKIMADAQKPGADPTSFEAAMPILFWMLGLSTAYTGLKRLGEVPDSLMCSPEGHIAVLECTTGQLKEDRKLPILYERASKVRRALESSPIRQTRVLPIIVTSMREDDIEPDLKAAAELGIHVVAQEAIMQLLEATLLPPDGDSFYATAERIVGERRAALNERDIDGGSYLETEPL